MKAILNSIATAFSLFFIGAVAGTCLLVAASSGGLFWGAMPVTSIALAVFFLLVALAAGTLTGQFAGLLLVPAFAMAGGMALYVHQLMGVPGQPVSIIHPAKLLGVLPWIFVAICAVAALINIIPPASEEAGYPAGKA